MLNMTYRVGVGCFQTRTAREEMQRTKCKYNWRTRLWSNGPRFWFSGRIQRNCYVEFRRPGRRHLTGALRGHRSLTIDPAKRTVKTDRSEASGSATTRRRWRRREEEACKGRKEPEENVTVGSKTENDTPGWRARVEWKTRKDRVKWKSRTGARRPQITAGRNGARVKEKSVLF